MPGAEFPATSHRRAETEEQDWPPTQGGCNLAPGFKPVPVGVFEILLSNMGSLSPPACSLLP